jgi:hypothetical protein
MIIPPPLLIGTPTSLLAFFRAFEETIPTSIPAIAPQTLPTKSTATDANIPDLTINTPDITAPNGIPPNIASSHNDTPGSDADLAYSHVYHYDVLRADKTDHRRRRTGTDDDTNIPTPHPLWQSADIAKAVDTNVKEFLNMNLAPLLSSDPEVIREFYRSLTPSSSYCIQYRSMPS